LYLTGQGKINSGGGIHRKGFKIVQQ
jgi:hypothetical protein